MLATNFVTAGYLKKNYWEQIFNFKKFYVCDDSFCFVSLVQQAQMQQQYAQQMSSILDYFEQLSELDTTNVEPTLRAIDVQNITRVDEHVDYPNLEGLYNSAPAIEAGFFKVPKIMKD